MNIVKTENNKIAKLKSKRADAPIMVQVIVLAFICFVGEILAKIIPINCSSPVYDFVIVFLLLQFKIIRLEWLEKLSNILAGCMLLAFVPGTVNIVNELDQLLQLIFPAFLSATIGSVLVLLVSGWTVQIIMRIINQKSEKGDY